MKFSIRLTTTAGFDSYLSKKGKTSWSKRQAQRHIKHAKTLTHFQGYLFHLEEN